MEAFLYHVLTRNIKILLKLTKIFICVIFNSKTVSQWMWDNRSQFKTFHDPRNPCCRIHGRPCFELFWVTGFSSKELICNSFTQSIPYLFKSISLYAFRNRWYKRPQLLCIIQETAAINFHFCQGVHHERQTIKMVRN